MDCCPITAMEIRSLCWVTEDKSSLIGFLKSTMEKKLHRILWCSKPFSKQEWRVYGNPALHMSINGVIQLLRHLVRVERLWEALLTLVEWSFRQVIQSLSIDRSLCLLGETYNRLFPSQNVRQVANGTIFAAFGFPGIKPPKQANFTKSPVELQSVYFKTIF